LYGRGHAGRYNHLPKLLWNETQAAVKRLALLLLLGCTHAAPAPAPPPAPRPPPPPDPLIVAQKLSEEAHAVLLQEGELLWTRLTTEVGT